MKIAATQLCRCGHRAASHTAGVFSTCDEEDIADLDVVTNNSIKHGICEGCIKFELPNLDLIEMLAKERGLI